MLSTDANAAVSCCKCACTAFAHVVLVSPATSTAPCLCLSSRLKSLVPSFCCRIGRFYNPELDLAQRREAKLEAKSLSVFGSTDGAGKQAGNGTHADKEVPTDTV